jgi:hypothetical protein
MGQAHIILAKYNHNSAEIRHPYLDGRVMEDHKPMRPNYYVTRNRAARECYRRGLNFMQFMRDHPEQLDTEFIDSNVFLTWLAIQGMA